MKKFSWSLIPLIFALLVFETGCAGSRPRHSGRKGIFDRAQPVASRGTVRGEGGGARAVMRSPAQDQELTAVRLKRMRRMVAGWRWPVAKVQVTSEFGHRDGGFHDGIDLKAPLGTPIYSVAGGTVLYSGSQLSGYGNLLIIKHGPDLSSVYAHNSKILVRKGQVVKAGQLVAKSGASGRVRGPHLHFEIRSGLVSVDPQTLLGQPIDRNLASSRNVPRLAAKSKFKSRR